MSDDNADRVTAMPWGDLELLSLSWVEGGRDLLLNLRLPVSTPERSHERSLLCRWTHGVVMRLEFQEGRGGCALTWDTTFTRRSDDTWSVLFDFGSCGELRFNCNELELVSAESESTSGAGDFLDG